MRHRTHVEFMYSTASVSPSLRRWLSVQDGELLVEPLPGISFNASASREELNDHLTELASYGVLELALQQDDGATYFTILSNGEATMLVCDDDSDRLVAVVPIRE